ncbi:MAG: peptidase penicillin amidase, partial [Thermoleophilia bacterium]|nr:peptidase penicillin amidase [Thermoleophilia bacterium]
MVRTRTTLGVALSALASVGVAAYMSGRRALPSWSGHVQLATLDGPVEVLRDRWGIASVFAQTSADAYRVQGWLHGTDRTFQLDLLRRIGLGRLSELVGEPGLATDRLVHTLGFAHHVDREWEALDADARAALTAYTEGVNAAFRRARRRVPVEFRLLSARPETWQPRDCLALGRVMALGLSGNWESELARGEIAARFGTDVLDAIEPGDHVRTWPAQLQPDVLGELVAAARAATSFGGPGGTGSNAWVVGPRRTRSGGALLANDPHLDLQLPSVWYEQRLSGGDLDVRGFTFPGVPGVVLGHNSRVAWGFTNSSIDVQDCYLEELDADGACYRDVGGEWKPLEQRIETIRIKGGGTEEVRVRSTRRGPIITDVATSTALPDPVSLRWDSLRAGGSAETVYRLNRATDWTTFRAALEPWLVPAQNVVFADAYGNIGMQHMGEVPVRAAGNDGSVPRRGDDPAGEWVDTIAWDEQPSSFNPPAARLVTANDRLVGDDYPHFMSREWMNGYRGARIRSLIDATEGHTVGDQVRIQTDVHSTPGVQVRDLLIRLDPAPKTSAGQHLFATLTSWDGELRVDDAASTAWRLLQRALQDETFGFLGELLPRFLGYSRTGANGFWSLFGRSTPTIISAIERDDRTLLDAAAAIARRQADSEVGVGEPLSGWTPAESWRVLAARALDRAAAAQSGQRRSREHRVRLRHPLGGIPGLGRVANRGPFAMPGDPDTVLATSHFHNPANDCAMVGPKIGRA